jgi:hypothetical protein
MNAISPRCYASSADDWRCDPLFAMEKLELTVPGITPTHSWTRYAVCASRQPLERVRAGLRGFGIFRVILIPTDAAETSDRRTAA